MPQHITILVSKEVLFGWAAENFTDTLLLWQALHFSKIQGNWIVTTCCCWDSLLSFSSVLRWIKKWNVQCICVCCFALASVTYQSKSKVAAVRWFVFYLCGFFLSRCFTFPHHLVCTLQRHHPKLSNPQPTKAPGGGLDQNPPKGSAIFQVLGVFLTSCTCIVKSRKKGCIHKSATKSGCGEVIWIFLR